MLKVFLSDVEGFSEGRAGRRCSPASLFALLHMLCQCVQDGASAVYDSGDQRVRDIPVTIDTPVERRSPRPGEAMNPFQKVAVLVFRLVALYMLGLCLRGVLAISAWGLGEWLTLIEGVLLFVVSRPLGQFVGRDLG
jgi:hypothetical protein